MGRDVEYRSSAHDGKRRESHHRSTFVGFCRRFVRLLLDVEFRQAFERRKEVQEQRELVHQLREDEAMVRMILNKEQ